MDTTSRLAEMERFADRGAFDEMAEAAHSLKGSASNLGARDLASKCRNLELAAKAREAQNMKETLDSVFTEFNRVSSFLEKEKARH